MRTKKIDKIFLLIMIVLITVGFFIFLSASLGLLARDGAKFSTIISKQIFLGIILGSIMMFITSKINYLHWKKYAFYIFSFSLVLTACVFLPKIGWEHGGAKRWISLGFTTFQPAEFLKLGFVIYLAAWLANIKSGVQTFKFGVLPIFAILALTGLILLFQPDTGTFLVIFLSAVSMFIVAEGKWKHLGIILLIALIGFGTMAYTRPYLRERVMTFLQPNTDVLEDGYQLKQSLIAVGSGQFFGRGFGKSIQKFNFLPEPIGDSIFAVMSEEWGFLGGVFLISLFLAFAYRGLYLASKSKDVFGRLLITGIVILILSQSFLNIASMIGIFPLAGMPLLFVSQGGTALMFALLEVGIIFNISKYKL